MSIAQGKNYKFLSVFAVLWIILSSTSLAFAIKHMEICMVVLAGIAACFLLINKKIRKTRKINFQIAMIICYVLAFNLVVNMQNTALNKEIIILLIRCFSLMIIMSSIEKNKFFQYYVRIMVILAVISVICFVVIMFLPGTRLPFQKETIINGKYYIYTFYYTLGRWRVMGRNCGIFWEPGGYQIFLNIAFLMLVTKPELFKKGKHEFVITMVVLVVTILTTMSTTGYICFVIILIMGVFQTNPDKKAKRLSRGLIIIAMIAILIVESNVGIIESKAINQEGSFQTRYNDTKVSIVTALSKPFVGYGYGNTYTVSVLNKEGVLDNSSGLGSFMISFGVVVTCLYLIYICKRLKEIFELNFINTILASVLFILFIMSESVIVITIFVSFLFLWKDEKIPFRKSLVMSKTIGEILTEDS